MRQRGYPKVKGIVAGMIAITVPYQFASAEPIPASAQPEQVSRALTSEAPHAEPKPAAPIEAPEEKKPSALEEQAKKISFELNAVELEGNKVFPTKVLELLYKKQLHKKITVADLFTIVQDITNFYRNNGYIISRAILPPQKVKNGVVKVQVIEGYIDQVNVTGNPRGAKCLMQGFGDEVAKKRPLEISRMERNLTLANEVPGVSVKAVLAPSKDEAGAADLNMLTQTNLMSGYLSYDNYGTRFIGPQQMTANVGTNSLIYSGDALQGTLTKTPRGAELTYTDVNYSQAVNAKGVRNLIGWTRAHTHPLFTLQPQKVDGVNSNYYTNLQFPVLRERTKTLTLQTSFNFLDSNVEQFGNQQLYSDHLRSVGFAGYYNFSDKYYGANAISSEFRQGLPIWGYTSNTSKTAQTSRPGGRGDYTKVTLRLSRIQAIKGPFSAYVLATGQWAFNPLLSSEQFSFGGSQLGRGYDVAEIIGDKGAAGSLELRYDKGIAKFFIQALQFYAFYDVGSIWNYLNVGGTPTKETAMSAGAGVRVYGSKYFSGNLMWAQPLTRQVSALAQTEQVTVNGATFNRGNGKEPRVFFSIVAQWQ